MRRRRRRANHQVLKVGVGRARDVGRQARAVLVDVFDVARGNLERANRVAIGNRDHALIGRDGSYPVRGVAQGGREDVAGIASVLQHRRGS